MRVSIQDVMAKSGVKFGTSGARGLAVEMTDAVCYTYTRGFLQYLEATGDLKRKGGEVAVAGDLRPSTDRIMTAVLQAAADMGYAPVNCGKIPSPAVALFGLEKGIPAIMVTGSHIPSDRNGIKFNKCSGEVLKEDEAGICGQAVELGDGLFDASGASTRKALAACPVRDEARARYVARYLEAFGGQALRGMSLGIYQHSAVGRELLVQIFKGLGATVTALGFSEQFVPVDTEAIRPEDARLALEWSGQHRFDAIVSTDGDSDRPLLSDEQGRWLRGDVAGILCAKFLGADSVSTPVSCNSAVEKCHWFGEVRRTRIGSPYVVASMLEASARGARCVVGYEANGGFLLNSNVQIKGHTLRALPTRDALILLIGILLLARREGKSVSQLTALLPARFTASGLLKNYPQEKSRAILDRFTTGDMGSDQQAIEAVFGAELGHVASLDRTDGIRVTFENAEVLHLRPSGNAPEFRCYNEAASEERVQGLNARCLEILRQLA
jgi:phosphomannomutase